MKYEQIICDGCFQRVNYFPDKKALTVKCKCGHISLICLTEDHLRDVMQKKEPEQVKDANRTR